MILLFVGHRLAATKLFRQFGYQWGVGDHSNDEMGPGQVGHLMHPN